MASQRVLLVTALMIGVLVANLSAGSAVAVVSPVVHGGDTADVSVVDVVPANRSNLSGVHTVEAGSAVHLRGTTNRRPDDNAIDVSVVDGPDADRFGFAIVRSWGTDGVWTARLDVPATVTPGTYTLAVRVGEERDVQKFEVVERKRAALGNATRGDAAVRVTGVTLPDGGYVEIRAADAVVAHSTYLAPGAHDDVSVPLDAPGRGDLRAVAVLGTPDSARDPYRREGAIVSVPVEGASPTATATPTTRPTPSPSTPSTPASTGSPTATATPTTERSAPGFGFLGALIALVIGARMG